MRFCLDCGLFQEAVPVHLGFDVAGKPTLCLAQRGEDGCVGGVGAVRVHLFPAAFSEFCTQWFTPLRDEMRFCPRKSVWTKQSV